MAQKPISSSVVVDRESYEAMIKLQHRLAMAEKALATSEAMLATITTRCDILAAKIEESRGVNPAAERSRVMQNDFLHMGRQVYNSITSLVQSVLESSPESLVVKKCLSRLKTLARKSVLPCHESAASIVKLFAALDQFQDTIDSGEFLRISANLLSRACAVFVESNLRLWRSHVPQPRRKVHMHTVENRFCRNMVEFLSLLRRMLQQTGFYRSLNVNTKRRLRHITLLLK
jgi:hypothetical protein